MWDGGATILRPAHRMKPRDFREQDMGDPALPGAKEGTTCPAIDPDPGGRAVIERVEGDATGLDVGAGPPLADFGGEKIGVIELILNIAGEVPPGGLKFGGHRDGPFDHAGVGLDFEKLGELRLRKAATDKPDINRKAPRLQFRYEHPRPVVGINERAEAVHEMGLFLLVVPGQNADLPQKANDGRGIFKT